MSKGKRKRNRRKERKRIKFKSKSLKVYGINAAGLLSKMESFENVLKEVSPSIFCIQETKARRCNQIRTESSKNSTGRLKVAEVSV